MLVDLWVFNELIIDFNSNRVDVKLRIPCTSRVFSNVLVVAFVPVVRHYAFQSIVFSSAGSDLVQSSSFSWEVNALSQKQKTFDSMLMDAIWAPGVESQCTFTPCLLSSVFIFYKVRFSTKKAWSDDVSLIPRMRSFMSTRCIKYRVRRLLCSISGVFPNQILLRTLGWFSSSQIHSEIDPHARLFLNRTSFSVER